MGAAGSVHWRSLGPTQVDDVEGVSAHEPSPRYIAIMIEALTRLRKLPVAMAAFKRTLKMELFFLAETAIEETTAAYVAISRIRPPGTLC